MFLRLFLFWLTWATLAHGQELRVGSKGFTESVILGEVLTQSLRQVTPETGVQHRAQLGGTRVLWEALLAGEIDLYPEYTGTLQQEILHMPKASLEQLRERLRQMGVGLSRPWGFNNSYALGMLPERARELGLKTISGLTRYSALRLGFGNEFMSRQDGWPALQNAYSLAHSWVRGFDHDLAYRALKSGEIDLTDVYTTDAEVDIYQLTLLQDDHGHFPRYDAVVVYRLEILQNKAVASVLDRLAGSLDEAGMRGLNRQVRVDGLSEAQTARRWLGLETGSGAEQTRAQRMVKTSLEHSRMVAAAIFLSTLLGVPMGILAFSWPRAGRVVMALVGLIQTIPSLALLVFLIPVCGLGQSTAVMALTLYGLLPVVQGVHTGLHSIPAPLRESALALGLSTSFRWRYIDLPMALPAIVAGVQTSAVIAVGTATLAALIGGGGYGDPILTGVRLARTDLLLEGAVPAALMAVLVQAFFAKIYGRSLLP